jgi:small ligand-binding sensory domain FIST
VRPDLACVFVSGANAGESAAALERACDVLGARSVIGCSAHGVIADGQSAEGVPGVSVWAASLPAVETRAFHLEVLRTSDTIAILGMPQRRDDDVVGVILADPWSFPVDGFIAHTHDTLSGLPLIGALASGSDDPGETRLLVDGTVHTRGAVGVVLGGDLSVHTLVSQGCRPIGQPMTVMRAEGSTLLELAGRTALQQVRGAVAALSVEEQVGALRGLQLGVLVDEYADEHTASDFLVRGIDAADHVAGSITVGEDIEVGSTVQFLLRDAVAAHDDFAEVLSALRHRIGLAPLAGALLFSADTRGRSMFPSAAHDVLAVRDELGISGVAGFFAAGEIGPVAGRNQVHGFTATVLAFGT